MLLCFITFIANSRCASSKLYFAVDSETTCCEIDSTVTEKEKKEKKEKEKTLCYDKENSL